MKSQISVKGKMKADRWSPFSFHLIGKNTEERKAIADFVRPYYPKRPVDATTAHPDYRGLEQVDFSAYLSFSVNPTGDAVVQISIIPPNKLVRGRHLEGTSELDIEIKGDFNCQYCGPLSLALVGGNAGEKRKLAAWIRNYFAPEHTLRPTEIEDPFARGCLTIWFTNPEKTEADIRITVMPSLRFAASIAQVSRHD